MPHIHIDSLGDFRPPLRHGKVFFEWMASNIRHPEEKLIRCDVDGIGFFLQVKPRGEGVLVKAEKITRPSPNTLIKYALQAIVERVAPRVFYSNIADPDRDRLKAPHPCLKEITSFARGELPDGEIWVEVGFGSGRHLLHQARSHPDVHLIGLEIHRPSLEQVMRLVELERLDNVWLVDYDARLFMELLPSNSLARIFVHFPVPWDKKPHRRVISDDFVKEALRVLEPDGTLELRTDSENYFRYATEVFTRPKRCRVTIEKNAPAVVRSKYEDRWLRLEKNIYELHTRALEASPPREAVGGFDFDSGADFERLVRHLPQKALVKEGYFVHFERLYRIDDRSGVLRLSFGSFDRPEHKYILFDRDSARYFPSEPVPTRTNNQAHRAIKEWLCPA